MPKDCEHLPPTDHVTKDAPATASAASAALAALNPAALVLGRHLAAVERAYHAHDRAELAVGAGAKHDHDEAKTLLLERSDALRALIATTPAVTIGDAAVQVAIAANIACCITANDLKPREVKTKAQQIERMLYGIIPVIAAAAGLDMEEMDWADNDHIRVVRFAGVGVQS